MDNKKKNQFDRQNKWTAENRERFSVTFPLGTKERIKNIGAKSLNNYIYELVMNDLEKREKSQK